MAWSAIQGGSRTLRGHRAQTRPGLITAGERFEATGERWRRRRHPTRWHGPVDCEATEGDHLSEIRFSTARVCARVCVLWARAQPRPGLTANGPGLATAADVGPDRLRWRQRRCSGAVERDHSEATAERDRRRNWRRRADRAGLYIGDHSEANPAAVERIEAMVSAMARSSALAIPSGPPWAMRPGLTKDGPAVAPERSPTTAPACARAAQRPLAFAPGEQIGIDTDAYRCRLTPGPPVVLTLNT